MQFDFKGKTVLVTGSSRGIGRSIASMFAEAGAQVAVHYRANHEAVYETIASMPGDTHEAFAADLTDVQALERLVSSVLGVYGRIDVLVNNAGVYLEHPFTETGFDGWLQAWELTIRTNLMGTAHLSYLVGQHMIEQGGGRIVNVSSRGAFRGEPTAPAYGASKAGMNAMGQSLAQALAPHGVFVGTVAPGFVETDMAADILEGPRGDGIRAQSPLNRVAKPEEVAQAVLFLAAEGTQFMTGAVLDVNGASYLRT